MISVRHWDKWTTFDNVPTNRLSRLGHNVGLAGLLLRVLEGKIQGKQQRTSKKQLHHTEM